MSREVAREGSLFFGTIGVRREAHSLRSVDLHADMIP